MSAAQLFVVGVRLLAIYFLATALTNIPYTIFSYYIASNTQNMSASGFSSIGVLAGGVAYSAACAATGVLVLRHFSKYRLDAQSALLPSHRVLMAALIQLLGCYWLMDSLIRAVQVFASSIGINNTVLLRFGDLVGFFITAIVGWLVIKYAEDIVRRLDRIPVSVDSSP